MKSHLIVPCFVLVSVCGLLVWRAVDDERFVKHTTSVATMALPAPARAAQVIDAAPPSPPPAAPGQLSVWPNTEIVNQLRDADANAASHRAAIAKALPVLGHDQDVQLLVGSILIGHGDLIDGLAWKLLACMNCTQVDERIGYGCAAAGFCDPNLAYVDVLKRDFGEQAVADALVRLEEIEARIAINDPAALAIFTEIDEKRFPKDVGECVQLRTPTPECPPEEILRQTKEAYE
jgi:hypothetical protein